MQFLDEAKIYLKAGNVVIIVVSFRREKYIEFGGQMEVTEVKAVT